MENCYVNIYYFDPKKREEISEQIKNLTGVVPGGLSLLSSQFLELRTMMVNNKKLYFLGCLLSRYSLHSATEEVTLSYFLDTLADGIILGKEFRSFNV